MSIDQRWTVRTVSERSIFRNQDDFNIFTITVRTFQFATTPLRPSLHRVHVPAAIFRKLNTENNRIGHHVLVPLFPLICPSPTYAVSATCHDSVDTARISSFTSPLQPNCSSENSRTRSSFAHSNTILLSDLQHCTASSYYLSSVNLLCCTVRACRQLPTSTSHVGDPHVEVAVMTAHTR